MKTPNLPPIPEAPNTQTQAPEVPTAPVMETNAPEMEPQAPKPPKQKRTPWLIIASVILVLGLVVGGSVIYFQQQAQAEQAAIAQAQAKAEQEAKEEAERLEAEKQAKLEAERQAIKEQAAKDQAAIDAQVAADQKAQAEAKKAEEAAKKAEAEAANAQFEVDLSEVPAIGMTLADLQVYLPHGTYEPAPFPGFENKFTTDTMSYIIRDEQIAGYFFDVSKVSVWGQNFAAMTVEERLDAIHASDYNTVPVKANYQLQVGTIACQLTSFEEKLCTAAYNTDVMADQPNTDSLMILFDGGALAESAKK